MNKMKTTLLLVIIYSTAFAQHNNLKKLDWLLGSWEANQKSALIEETWKIASNITYEGKSTTQSKNSNKPIAEETIIITIMNSEIFYIAKVAHNNFPIAFKLVETAEDRAVFENKEHNFPQKLNYQLIAPNNIKVTVSGFENGKYSMFEIDYKRKIE